MLIKTLTLSLLVLCTQSFSAEPYFPDKHQWLSKPANELGLKQKALDKALDFAKNNEYSGSRDLRIAILKGFAKEPFHEILGPTKKRGGPAGVIVKNGYIVGQWACLSHNLRGAGGGRFDGFGSADTNVEAVQEGGGGLCRLCRSQ